MNGGVFWRWEIGDFFFVLLRGCNVLFIKIVGGEETLIPFPPHLQEWKLLELCLAVMIAEWIFFSQHEFHPCKPYNIFFFKFSPQYKKKKNSILIVIRR